MKYHHHRRHNHHHHHHSTSCCNGMNKQQRQQEDDMTISQLAATTTNNNNITCDIPIHPSAYKMTHKQTNKHTKKVFIITSIHPPTHPSISGKKVSRFVLVACVDVTWYAPFAPIIVHPSIAFNNSSSNNNNNTNSKYQQQQTMSGLCLLSKTLVPSHAHPQPCKILSFVLSSFPFLNTFLISFLYIYQSILSLCKRTKGNQQKGREENNCHQKKYVETIVEGTFFVVWFGWFSEKFDFATTTQFRVWSDRIGLGIFLIG